MNAYYVFWCQGRQLTANWSIKSHAVSCAGVPVTSVKFDYSGQYLAVGGQDARVYGVKQDWGLLSTMSDLPKKVSMPGQAMLAG